MNTVLTLLALGLLSGVGAAVAVCLVLAVAERSRNRRDK